MVSLSPSNNGRQHGGHFLDLDSSLTHATRNGGNDIDEGLLDASSLSVHSDHHEFKPIRTVPAVMMLIIFMLGLVLVSSILPVKWEENPSYSLTTYLHVGLWVLSLISHHFLHHQHQASRRRGHLNFYRHTYAIRTIPHTIISLGSNLILVVVMVMHMLCSDISCSLAPIKPTIYILIIISVEFVILLPILIIYIVRVIRFNTSQPAPDVLKDEQLLSSFMQSHISQDQIGFRNINYVDDILEKQADMIRYLKQQNSSLSRKVHALSTQLHQRSSEGL